MLVLVMVLVFTAVANAMWSLSESGKDVRRKNLPSTDAPGTSSKQYSFTNGGIYARVEAFTNPKLRNAGTSKSITITNWIRKRYDWRGFGSPTEVTANVSITITPSAKASGSVRTSGTSHAHAHAAAFGYASQSGGTPHTIANGHAQINVNVNYYRTTSWSFTVSTSSSGAPAASYWSSGTGGSLTKKDSGSVSLGGAFKFSQSGAQIYASTSARASASQSNRSKGSATAKSLVTNFMLDIP